VSVSENLAIEGSRELSDFLPFVEELYLNVRQVPGCTPSGYAAAVLALLDAGSIRLYFDTRDQDEVRPDPSMVEAVLTRRLQPPCTMGRFPLRKTDPRRPPPEMRAAEPDLRMELTALGGEVWEKRAEPDWSRYVQTLTGEESGEAWSGDEDLLIACLGWYEELNSAAVDRNTIRLEVLHDYSVTYWKLLPVVYRATFACTWDESQWGGKGRIGEPKWFRKWWVGQDNWYKKPWELPDWPRMTGDKSEVDSHD
jgi:hypothetical protein